MLIYKLLNNTKRQLLEITKQAVLLYKNIKLKCSIKKWFLYRYKEYKWINSDFHNIQVSSLKNK